MWKEPLKAEPQEVFVGPNTDPHMVFGRLGQVQILTSQSFWILFASIPSLTPKTQNFAEKIEKIMRSYVKFW